MPNVGTVSACGSVLVGSIGKLQSHVCIHEIHTRERSQLDIASRRNHTVVLTYMSAQRPLMMMVAMTEVSGYVDL